MQEVGRIWRIHLRPVLALKWVQDSWDWIKSQIPIPEAAG
jgi:hypothetical protein